MRRLFRNLPLAFVVALPLFIACMAVAIWLSPPVATDTGGLPTSASDALAGFVFWYLAMALPTGVFAIIHQLALRLPTRNAASSSRLKSVLLAIALSVAAALYVGATSLEVHWPTLLAVFAIPAGVFGWVARPVSGRPSNPLANER